MNKPKVESIDNDTPVVAITMGDPAGIGPDIIVAGWNHFANDCNIRFVVVGNELVLKNAARSFALQNKLPISTIEVIDHIHEVHAVDSASIVCCSDVALKLSTPENGFELGRVSVDAGDAAFRYIDWAIDAAKRGDVQAIVTAPINKESIRMAGHDFPGHTEILAERCGVDRFAMMLYIPDGQDVGGEIGVGVVHTTLHQSLRSALDDLSTEMIVAKCQLAHDFALAALRQKGIDRLPRIAVAALNPHAGENGLFGDEESTMIAPAVAEAKSLGIDCSGPIACDTLMGRAVAGEFDMVVAMYHDQGHIALKLLGMHKAVNVTLGLPIVRTSVAHGTAFKLAGTGKADCTSLLRAVEVAQRLVAAQEMCRNS